VIVREGAICTVGEITLFREGLDIVIVQPLFPKKAEQGENKAGLKPDLDKG